MNTTTETITLTDWLAAIDAALAICEARLAACDAADLTALYVMDVGLDEPRWFVLHRIDETTGHGFAGTNNEADARAIAQCCTDLPASLRRDIAGLQAHRDAEAEASAKHEIYNQHEMSDADFPARDVGRTSFEAAIAFASCKVHRAYNQRIFADCGVEVAE